MDPLLVVIFGLMGVGKSTVAQGLAALRGWPLMQSDVVRKTLAGLAPTAPARFPFGEGIYREEFSRRTYEEMFRQAREHLAAGAQAVILDASFKRAADREQVRALAREAGARVVFVQCVCPLEVVRERLRRREDNRTAVSDGRLEILDLQMEDFEPPDARDKPYLKLATDRQLPEIMEELQAFLSPYLSPGRKEQVKNE